MRNGQSTFLSNSVTVRNYSFSQRIDSQAGCVQFWFLHIPALNDHLLLAFVKLYVFFLFHRNDPWRRFYILWVWRKKPVHPFPSWTRSIRYGHTFLSWTHRPCIFIYLLGNGSTSRTRGTQLNGQCDLQSRERSIFLDYPQVVAWSDVSRKDENPVRE